MMRALPGMIVVAPGDPCRGGGGHAGRRRAARALLPAAGPGGGGAGPQSQPDLQARPRDRVREGRDVTIIASGGLLGDRRWGRRALSAARDSTPGAEHAHLKPLDEAAIVSAATETDALVTLEEHSVIGGLGSAVAEIVLEAGVRPRLFKRIGLADCHMAAIGDQDFLRTSAGLDVQGVTATIRELVQAGRGRRRLAGHQRRAIAADTSRVRAPRGTERRVHTSK